MMRRKHIKAIFLEKIMKEFPYYDRCKPIFAQSTELTEPKLETQNTVMTHRALSPIDTLSQQQQQQQQHHHFTDTLNKRILNSPPQHQMTPSKKKKTVKIIGDTKYAFLFSQMQKVQILTIFIFQQFNKYKCRSSTENGT